MKISENAEHISGYAINRGIFSFCIIGGECPKIGVAMVTQHLPPIFKNCLFIAYINLCYISWVNFSFLVVSFIEI